MADMATNELRCTICPKVPTFSDQSHLLTHIGSKGHLSHYFKAQVRSTSDILIRQRLTVYDEWYRKHDIAVMLSQRLESKDCKLKKPIKKASARVLKAEEPAWMQPNSEFETFPLIPTTSAKDLSLVNPCIDPNLEHVKREEAEDHAIIPHLVTSYAHGKSAGRFPLDQLPTPRPLRQRPLEYTGGVPSSQLNGQMGYWLRQPQPLQHPSAPLDGGLNAQDWFFYQTPLDDQLPSIEGSISASHSRNTSTTEGSTEFDAKSNSHRLKGAIWPGMDLFDTANEESKRRRNQKKDISAIHQLAEHSKAIEPTEVIFFYPSWEVKKARFISGNVESSPPRELTPEPKPPIRRKRRALKELGPNAPVKERKTRGKTRAKTTPAPIRRSTRNRVPSGSDGEPLDLMRPLYGQKKQRTRTFKVFEDSPGDKNVWYGHEQYTPTPLYPGHFIRAVEDVQSSLETEQLPQSFGNGHTALTPRAGPEMEENYAWPALEFNHQLFLPDSPLVPHTMSGGHDDVGLPQLIMPRRIFLKDAETQNGPNAESASINLPSDHDSQQQLALRSPTRFSLAELLAYNRTRTPYCSPPKQGQQLWSPSYFDFKTGLASDPVGGTSGDDTIDLGIGDAEQSG